ncbi:hypothetical protein ACIHEJ_38625 [Streptomyces sp. NPDC052301]|uniref:hypothetical protein n=1 Tax=Streptomyces sp. NPDC052301 TaxID=3365687 RepID=UPI0037CDFCA5
MPWRPSRRREASAGDDQSSSTAPQPAGLLAMELSTVDYQALVRVIEHAQSCLEAHSDSDAATIRSAGGAELLPLLYPRAGLALARGVGNVPLLESEIRHVEAAVINLESYGGHETVLCEGYGLLRRLTELTTRAREAHVQDGVLTLSTPSQHAPCRHCH